MSEEVKTTLEYRPQDKKLTIVVRQNGKETARIIADTIPPSADRPEPKASKPT